MKIHDNSEYRLAALALLDQHIINMFFVYMTTSYVYF